MSTSDRHVAQVNIAGWGAARFTPARRFRFDARADPTRSRTRAPASCGASRATRETRPGSAFGDDRIIVNLSVWETIEALGRFVFASRHGEVLRRRREWFDEMAEAHLAPWIPAGTIPTVREAERRDAVLRERGAWPDAFTLREPFPAPGSNVPVPSQNGWRCPT